MKNRRLKPGDIIPDLNFLSSAENSVQKYSENDDDKLISIFILRYSGCPLCQLTISELISHIGLFSDSGCQVYAIFPGKCENIKVANLPFGVVCDYSGDILKSFGITKVSLFGYVHPRVMRRAKQARQSGYLHGKRDGQEFQRPAFFLLKNDGKILFSYYGKHIADLPDWETIESILQKYRQGGYE